MIVKETNREEDNLLSIREFIPLNMFICWWPFTLFTLTKKKLFLSGAEPKIRNLTQVFGKLSSTFAHNVDCEHCRY